MAATLEEYNPMKGKERKWPKYIWRRRANNTDIGAKAPTHGNNPR